MKRLLVTGSAGLVGSATLDFFVRRKWEVLGIDNNMRSYFFNTSRMDVKNNVDIRDEEIINEVFQKFEPDAIVHAAAQPSHDWAKREPLTDFDVNARGTLVLLEATRKYAPGATFVYVSTDKVYGENMHTELVSNDLRNVPLPDELGGGGPIYDTFDEFLGLDFAGRRSLFGCSKAAADMYTQEYGNYFEMNTACFRPGCITGAAHQGAELHGFLAYLAKCVREGTPYTIFGDGKQVRDQIHATDLANAFWHFIENPKKGAVYNIGGGIDRSVSVLEAIQLIEKELGKKAIVEYGEERQGDRRYDVHDVSRFRSDYTEWDYTYSLNDIIKDVCHTK